MILLMDEGLLASSLKSPKTSSLRHRRQILFPTVRHLARYLDDFDNAALRCRRRPENAPRGDETKVPIPQPRNEQFTYHKIPKVTALITFGISSLGGSLLSEVVIFAELHRRSASQEGLHLVIPFARQYQLITMRLWRIYPWKLSFKHSGDSRPDGESFWTFKL